jgi:uncharacterized protein with HEPN domain
MTLRDREAFLWDMLQAARNIENFIDGKTLDEYESDDLLRSAVERQFLIIGEAASQAVRHFPDLQEENRRYRTDHRVSEPIDPRLCGGL